MSVTMTSRERVLAAFSRTEGDRVPVDYDANAGIDARLKRHFRLAADDDEGLLRALGVDFRGVGAPYEEPKIHADVPGRRVDPLWGIHTKWIEHESGGYWDFCDFPLAGATPEEVEAWPFPSPDDFDYQSVPARCRRHAGFAVGVGHPGLGDVINSTGMLFGMENVLVGLMTDDPAVLAYVDRKAVVNVEVTRRTIEAARGKADFLWLGEDLGTQRGPLVSIDLFRRHVRPWIERYVAVAKSFGIPVMVHSCGSSSWAFDDFIEMGVGVVDTLQPEAADMAPAYLKGRFGDRLAFHGCISTAGPLAYGSVDDVVATVRDTLGVMMPGGGYCLAPTHAIQDNSPTENVVAMYAAARELGAYS